MRMVSVLTLVMVRVRMVLGGGGQEGGRVMRVIRHGVVMLSRKQIGKLGKQIECKVFPWFFCREQ
jgi:hypothetical protein